MNRLIATLTAMTIVALSATPVAAHDEYRIIGTVTKITATQIDVKQVKDGQVISIKIDEQTKATRDKKPAALKDVKTSGSVVVEALGDSLKDLLAIEIRLVPAIPSTKQLE